MASKYYALSKSPKTAKASIFKVYQSITSFHPLMSLNHHFFKIKIFLTLRSANNSRKDTIGLKSSVGTMKNSIPRDAFLVCFKRITKLLRLREKSFFTVFRYQMRKQRLLIHALYLRLKVNNIFQLRITKNFIQWYLR